MLSSTHKEVNAVRRVSLAGSNSLPHESTFLQGALRHLCAATRFSAANGCAYCGVWKRPAITSIETGFYGTPAGRSTIRMDSCGQALAKHRKGSPMYNVPIFRPRKRFPRDTGIALTSDNFLRLIPEKGVHR